MQITLNKVPFDLRPVEGPLRRALLADPAVARAASREVWAWDGERGQALVPLTERKGVALPPGLAVFVPRAGVEAGGPPQRADGPTRKMAERFLAALGAKGFPQVMQALARVTGIPQKTIPFDAFAAVKPHPHRIRMDAEFAVVELSNAARNLQAFLFVPGLVSFAHAMDEVPGGVPEGAPAPGSIRPGFVIPPLNQAVHAIRRMAVARALTEMQASLGETRPADLAADDARRAEVARLGAEWKVLQSKPAKAA